MTPHILDGSFERVIRAEEHLADLRQRLVIFCQQHAEAIVPQINPNPPYEPYLLIPEAQGSMRIPILIGEICYNLRTALDYLVFQLAKHDSRRPQDNTQFPIEDTKKSFNWRKKKWLKGISCGHVAAIERLQPYNGCDWTKVLKVISNPDKHREFIPLGGQVGVVIYSAFADPEFRASSAPIRSAPHPTRGEVHMKVEAKVTPLIAGMQGFPVLETL